MFFREQKDTDFVSASSSAWVISVRWPLGQAVLCMENPQPLAQCHGVHAHLSQCFSLVITGPPLEAQLHRLLVGLHVHAVHQRLGGLAGSRIVLNGRHDLPRDADAVFGFAVFGGQALQLGHGWRWRLNGCRS